MLRRSDLARRTSWPLILLLWIAPSAIGQTIPVRSSIQLQSFTEKLAISADGRILAVALQNNDKGGPIRFLDCTTGNLLATLNEHTDRVHCLAFSPDGKTLATGSWDKTVKLWDMSKVKLDARNFKPPIRATLLHSNHVETLAFSKDGKTLATGCYGSMTLWDVAKGKERGTTDERTQIRRMVMSPDGKTIATAYRDSVAKLWNSATFKTIGALVGHEAEIVCVDFSPDGKWVATGSKDRTVRLWDVKSRKEVGSIVHPVELRFLAFLPRGNLLATVCHDHSKGGEIVVYELTARTAKKGAADEPAVTAKPKFSLGGPTRETIPVIAVSGDGKTLVSGGFQIRFWNLPTPKK